MYVLPSILTTFSLFLGFLNDFFARVTVYIYARHLLTRTTAMIARHCRWFLVATVAISTLQSASPQCASDMDCSLNGQCSGSSCVCDAGWVGPQCALLNLGMQD